ncbi:hypothetical protein GCM10027193_01340 [Arenimonas aestuarii]
MNRPICDAVENGRRVDYSICSAFYTPRLKQKFSVFTPARFDIV